MAFKIVDGDNIRESFTSSGTTITLGGAVGTSRAFSAWLTSGDTFFGTARKGSEYSTGLFTYTTGSIAQTEVWVSSNSNAAVSFSSGGTGEIFHDPPARIFDNLNLRPISVTSAATFDIGAAQGARILSSGTTGPVTSLGTGKNKLRIVTWSGATLTCNTTSLILIGLANGATRVTAAGDVGVYVSDNSGNWTEVSYTYASGKIYSPVDGTAALPAFTWASDPDSGLYRIGANNIGVAVNGAKVLDISTTGLSVTGAHTVTDGSNNHVISFSGTPGGYNSIYKMDATGLKIGHNSSARNIEFQTNSLTRFTISGAGAASFTGALSTSDTTTSTDRSTGAAIVGNGSSGGLGVGGQVSAGNFRAFLAPTSAYAFDAQQASASVSLTGSGSALSANCTPTTGGHYGFIFVCENGVVGDCGVYAIIGGSALLINGGNGTFVTPTATPAAGKACIHYDGSRFKLYSNITGAATFTVAELHLTG